MKKCSKCGVSNGTRATACSQCEYPFPKATRKAPRDPEPEAREEVEKPEFAVGATSDGGILLFWPRADEQIILTRREATIIDEFLRRLRGNGAATADELPRLGVLSGVVVPGG